MNTLVSNLTAYELSVVIALGIITAEAAKLFLSGLASILAHITVMVWERVEGRR